MESGAELEAELPALEYRLARGEEANLEDHAPLRKIQVHTTLKGATMWPLRIEEKES